jgi:hypothetical protein
VASSVAFVVDCSSCTTSHERVCQRTQPGIAGALCTHTWAMIHLGHGPAPACPQLNIGHNGFLYTTVTRTPRVPCPVSCPVSHGLSSALSPALSAASAALRCQSLNSLLSPPRRRSPSICCMALGLRHWRQRCRRGVPPSPASSTIRWAGVCVDTGNTIRGLPDEQQRAGVCVRGGGLGEGGHRWGLQQMGGGIRGKEQG